MKDWLRDPMKQYLHLLKEANNPDFGFLNDLSSRCQLIHLSFDYFNLESISQVFKNKQPHNIEKYI